MQLLMLYFLIGQFLCSMSLFSMDECFHSSAYAPIIQNFIIFSGVLAVLERDRNSQKFNKMWQSMRRQSNSLLESARNFYPYEQENRVVLQMHVAYNYHKEAPQKCFQVPVELKIHFFLWLEVSNNLGGFSF